MLAAALAQQALAVGARTPAPAFTLSFTLLAFLATRVLGAFAFGYTFAHLRGSSGVTKATVFALVEIVATLPLWLFSGSLDTIPAEALAILGFYVVVGFIAFDLQTIRYVRRTLLTPRRLIAIAGLQDLTVVFAIFSGSIASLLTGQLSAIASLAINSAFPHTPVPVTPH